MKENIAFFFYQVFYKLKKQQTSKQIQTGKIPANMLFAKVESADFIIYQIS